jgi:hypothetical protein
MIAEVQSELLPSFTPFEPKVSCRFQTKLGKDALLQRAVRPSAAIVITPALCGLRHRDQRI